MKNQEIYAALLDIIITLSVIGIGIVSVCLLILFVVISAAGCMWLGRFVLCKTGLI